jgi:urease accessory protein
VIGIETPPRNANAVLAPGSGSLAVVRRSTRSVVTRAIATSPLRLLTPRNHGPAAWVYSSTYGGGLVGGDAICLDVSIASGATMMLSTQASTKIYRSTAGTSSHLDATISSGGLLAILPDPVVCFASSAHRQEQRIRLESDATLIVVDWLSSGRRAAGERWRFDRYSSRLEVHRNGSLMILDALHLDRRDGSLESRMGRFEVLCTIALVGPAVSLHASRALSLVTSMPVERGARLLAAGSPLRQDGAIIRVAGMSFEEVAAVVRNCLRFVPSLLGDDPWARKW